jgi:DNA-binding PadR family transcriptional regulator
MQALLGLLTIEPMSGYDLGQTVQASIGYIWRESYGQIYPNLKRLAAEGLVESRAERQEGKPERLVYSITKKGRQKLVEWLETEPQPEIPRNEMLLKLFFGAQVPAQVLINYVESMVQEHRLLLEKFSQVEDQKLPDEQQYPDAPFWKMTARFGRMELEAHLAWAEQTLSELRKLDKKKQRESSALHKEKIRAN